MQRLTNAARCLFGFLAGTSMALVFAIIFLNSLSRYFFEKSAPWGEELPIYLTIYGVMFGVALAYLDDNHIRFTILVDMISNKTRETLYLLVDVITLISGGMLAYAGHMFAMRRGSIAASGLKSSANWLVEKTGIEALVWVGKVGTWQYAIAIGGVMLSVAAILKFIKRLNTLRSL